ncbi:MAG: DNA methyltransferase [Sphaerochaetaceae bacterium]
MSIAKQQQLEPESFSLELNTVWSFPERGSWATHNGSYRGNWSPYIPRNLLLRYTKEGDVILDQFAGGGTTLVEAKLLNRNAIGYDINPLAIKRCEDKLAFEYPSTSEITIAEGDACHLDQVNNESIDFICTHPPYADIIKYSKDISRDISLLKKDEFLDQMRLVANESFRVLKPKKYCAILIGDMRKSGSVIPLGFEVMNIFLNSGFYNKEIIIKEQHNCTSTSKWAESSIKYNFFLLAHEYLFIFRKN